MLGLSWTLSLLKVKDWGLLFFPVLSGHVVGRVPVTQCNGLTVGTMRQNQSMNESFLKEAYWELENMQVEKKHFSNWSLKYVSEFQPFHSSSSVAVLAFLSVLSAHWTFCKTKLANVVRAVVLKCDPSTRSISIAWEHVRNASYWALFPVDWINWKSDCGAKEYC